MPYTDFHWVTDRLAIGGWIAEPGHDLPFDAILSLETAASIEIGDWVREGAVDYRWHSIMDFPTGDPYGELVEHFDQAAALIDEWVGDNKTILVHCWAGVSRSATAIVWYLIRYQGYTWDAAVDHIRSKRTIVFPNVTFEIPLRIANGEHLTEQYVRERIAAFVENLRVNHGFEEDPQSVWERLEQQGTVPQHLHSTPPTAHP